MIDAFNAYVNQYDLNDINIKLKYNHSFRVMELAKKYAIRLGWSKEDIELATLIGLLHDFGRFEQLRVYHSYNDRTTIDHADYSVEQLFTKGEIKKFTSREDWYPIVEFAIKYHNKKDIPCVEDERMLMHARFIRDMDKVDIMYIEGVLDELQERADDSIIRPEIMEQIENHILVDSRLIKTYNDALAIQYAFVFDINNAIVLEEYKKYFTCLHKLLAGGEQFNHMFEITMKYCDERIEEYERNRNKV